MDTAERSILRAKAAYDKYQSSRKAKSIKLIPLSEVRTGVTEIKGICKAVNLSGKPCSNRAICNGLCKRHAY